MEFRFRNATNITFNDCIAGSDCIVNGFEKEPVRMLYIPKQFSFAGVPNYKDYMQRARNYQKLVFANARRLYIQILEGKAFLCYLYDPKTDLVAAFSKWNYPEHESLERRPGFLKRVYIGLLGIYYKALTLFNFIGTGGHHFVAFKHVWASAARVCGVERSEKIYEALANMSPQQLETAAYPPQDTHELVIYATRGEMQGMGLGKKLMRQCLDMLKGAKGHTVSTKSGSVYLPPKVSLFATEHGAHLYSKVGFYVAAHGDYTLKNGENMVHRYFMINL